MRLCLLFAAACTLAAAAEAPVYRLDFTLSEGPEAAATPRHYSLVLRADNSLAGIRAGKKIPYASSVTGEGKSPQRNFQYAEVGTNLDCRLREQDNQLAAFVQVEISSVTTGGAQAGGNPVIQQVRGHSETVLVPGQPSLLFQVDDPITRRTYRIEATAEKIK